MPARKQSKKQSSKKGGGKPVPGVPSAPPFGSYDPAIDAERRAGRRGLGDIKQDIRLEQRWEGEDLETKLADLQLRQLREQQDAYGGLARYSGQAGLKQADLDLDAQRGREDFARQLDNLTRRFVQQGDQQRQVANAQGVFYGGTQAASAAKRAENFAVARQPIDVGRQRLEEDYQRSGADLYRRGHELYADTQTELGRLGEDVEHDRALALQAQRRSQREAKIRKQRAIREQKFADVDLTSQAVYQAGQLNPGSFSSLAKQQPDYSKLRPGNTQKNPPRKRGR